MNFRKFSLFCVGFSVVVFCRKSTLVVESNNAPVPQEKPIPVRKLRYSDGKYMIVDAKGGLKLRDTPGSASRVEELIPDKSVVLVRTSNSSNLYEKETIDGYEGEWLQTHFYGQIGYTFSRFLKPLTEPNGHLYLIGMSELSALAAKESSVREKARLYEILHRRFLEESGSSYCTPGDMDLGHCLEACERASEHRYCQAMTKKGFNGTLGDFQDTVIRAILSSDSVQLLNLGVTCMVYSQICIACDGNGSVPFPRKVQTIVENSKYISPEGIKKTPYGVQFKGKSGYKKSITEDYGQSYDPVPFLSVEFTTIDGAYFIKNFLGDLVFGQAECVAGL